MSLVESLQMAIVTTIISHTDSQALGDICHRFVDVFLWQLFPDCLQSDFQLINRLGFWLSLWYFYSIAAQK